MLMWHIFLRLCCIYFLFEGVSVIMILFAYFFSRLILSSFLFEFLYLSRVYLLIISCAVLFLCVLLSMIAVNYLFSLFTHL